MNLIQWVKDNIDDFRAYGQGQEFGEELKEQGVEEIDEEALHQWHINNGIETPNWTTFNRGVQSILGPGSSSDQ